MIVKLSSWWLSRLLYCNVTLQCHTNYFYAFHLNWILWFGNNNYINLKFCFTISVNVPICPLKRLPAGIEQCTHLYHLNVHKCQLTIIPQGLAKCQITELDIGGNFLDGIPAVVFECTKLKHLVANQINITDIPEEIGKLTRLTTLNLSGCTLASLPDSFKHLTQLEVSSMPVRNNLFLMHADTARGE